MAWLQAPSRRPMLRSQLVRSRPHYVFLRYANSPNFLNVFAVRLFISRRGSFVSVPFKSKKGATMRTKIHAADYYRRILSIQGHALKRLDSIAKIVRCNRGQEIAGEPGLSGQWYYVIVGAVRCSAVRSDGRRQIIDLMLPQ